MFVYRDQRCLVANCMLLVTGSTGVKRRQSSFLAVQEAPGSFSVTVHVAKEEAANRNATEQIKAIEQRRP